MNPDWNQRRDFDILFLPRSGSHMLVDLLNSHPDLDVTHSDQGHHGKGHIKGHAHCVPEHAQGKVIILTRNARDRTLSFFTDIANVIGTNHAYKPVEIHRTSTQKCENRFKNQEEKNKKFIERCENLDCEKLWVSYEGLTGNKDIRELNYLNSKVLCEFLGVETKILKTRLHKPKVNECKTA